MKDILFLEDDKLLAKSIVEELEEASYSVDWVGEGDEAAELCYENRYKLYLFDVSVPGINGFDLLSQLRQSGDTTATIFLTSQNQLEDLKQGFDAGADDYIKKPFDLYELLIRIKSKMPKSSEVMLSKTFAINAGLTTLTCKGVSQKLPQKEFALLEYFIANEGVYLSPEDMIDALYEDSTISLSTFRTYIKNIKRHVQECAQIDNIRGVGYRFNIV